ncbi:hypothetical protein NNO55_15385, partial [Enterococcus faecalis]
SLKTLYRKRTVIWPFYFYTIIRTLSFLALTIFAMVTPFIFSSEASAREAEFGSSCPGGFYFKKGGWSTGGKNMSGGYCVPLGNMGNMNNKIW